MNISMMIAGVLTVILGLMHSVLGEKLLLGPLFRQTEMPKLLGSSLFARRTLRMAWHLTTILLLGIGAIIIVYSRAETSPTVDWFLKIFSLTFGLCALISLIGSRAKHFSWVVFLAIAAALWHASA